MSLVIKVIVDNDVIWLYIFNLSMFTYRRPKVINTKSNVGL